MFYLPDSYMNYYRDIRLKDEYPDGRYIPKRSTVVKNKKRNINKKKRRNKK